MESASDFLSQSISTSEEGMTCQKNSARTHHIIGKWADQKGNFPRIGARPFQTFSEQSKVIFSKSFFRIVQSGLFTSCVTEKILFKPP